MNLLPEIYPLDLRHQNFSFRLLLKSVTSFFKTRNLFSLTLFTILSILISPSYSFAGVFTDYQNSKHFNVNNSSTSSSSISTSSISSNSSSSSSSVHKHGPLQRESKYLSTDNIIERSYDEMFDERGQVRAHYRPYVELLSKIDSKDMQSVKQVSFADFSGDNALLPFPRIFTQKEIDELRAGVAQRAKAIRAFLQDHYSRKRSYLKAHIIPEKVLEQIITRFHENLGMYRNIRPDQIAFWYGPDIIRGPDGKFHIIEDNPTFIGGLGDIVKAKEILMTRIPVLKKLDHSPDPESFFTALIESYKGRRLNGGEEIVMVHYPPSMTEDKESLRLRKILGKLGVESVIINQHSPTHNQLVVENDEVFLLKPSGIKSKVGLVINNVDIVDLDPTNKNVWKKYVYEWGLTDNPKIFQWIKEKYNGVLGILDAYYKGKVALVNPPGVDFIGDKQFYMYVEDMIRFYLKEEPIITNLPTLSFGDHPELIEEVFDSECKNKNECVVKQVDGSGGSAVWVGAKINCQEFLDVKKQVSEHPEDFIVQKYTPLSQVNGHLVDTRVIVDIGPNTIITSPVPWGRGVANAGSNGKVNLCDKGGEIAVLVYDPSNSSSSSTSSSSAQRPLFMSKSKDNTITDFTYFSFTNTAPLRELRSHDRVFKSKIDSKDKVRSKAESVYNFMKVDRARRAVNVDKQRLLRNSSKTKEMLDANNKQSSLTTPSSSASSSSSMDTSSTTVLRKSS